MKRVYPVSNVFAQDDIAVVPDRLFVTIGAKYEHNDFSGGEFQPNVRAPYLMPRSQIVWGSLARAVRRPTRFDDDIRVSTPGGVLVVVGSGDFRAESLVAGEAGYRIQPSPLFAVDADRLSHHIMRTCAVRTSPRRARRSSSATRSRGRARRGGGRQSAAGRLVAGPRRLHLAGDGRSGGATGAAMWAAG